LNEFAHTGCHGYLQGLLPTQKTGADAAWDCSTLLPLPSGINCKSQTNREKRFGKGRCYHHNGMRPQKIGRTLGIGLRIAGRVAGQRMAANGRAGENASTAQTARDASVRGRTAGRTAKVVARGVGGFLRPFRRVGGIVWLQVMGVLFLLPAAVFAPTLWRVRANWAQGPNHRLFLVTAVVIGVFLYLSTSSFWRARKR
jgi:hypothetical protein